jgi:hypothetical protein
MAPLMLLLAALAPPATAQHAQAATQPPTKQVDAGDRFGHRIPGTVRDLSRDSAGRILYCTAEGEVGRIVPGAERTVLATAASGPFPDELRGVAETPDGDVAVVDWAGDVRVLQGGTAPAALVYDDAYMIEDATDLLVDARGNFLIASATPTPGQRAVNWVSDDGYRWGYYLVKHQPVQLAHDPLTGGVVLAETTSGGNLQLVTAGSAIRATTGLDTTTHPGISAAQDDGDVAAESNGDLYWIAGGSVYRRSRSAGTTALFAAGYGQLRGIVIAASSGFLASPTGWSLYLAEGANPTHVREIANVGAPGDLVALDQGFVPGRGIQVNVSLGFQVYELAADDLGRLLLGGTNFGTTHYVKRVTLTGTPSIATVATSANGLAGIVEGLCVAPDDSIYALARAGTIQRITEGPLAVTTVFSDPGNQVTAGKDLALDVNGDLYVACREAWDFGKLLKVSGGGATLLELTEESRGLAANPGGGLLVSQWRNPGFQGTVDLYDFSDDAFVTLPGFAGMNYTNDSVWGDGDICVDANGSVYTVSEDDWSLVRYDPALDGFVRVGSGYKNHPSGLAIAPSTSGSGSTTGWSLYVSEFDYLWEKPSVQAPASTLVDASLGLVAGRTVAAAPHPGLGKPRSIALLPGGGVVIATAEARVLLLDPATGAIQPLAGPEHGLRGDLVALGSASGGRILVLNRDGEAFEVRAGRARALPAEPARLESVLSRALAEPERRLRLPGGDWLVLDGWVVWREPMQ